MAITDNFTRYQFFFLEVVKIRTFHVFVNFVFKLGGFRLTYWDLDVSSYTVAVGDCVLYLYDFFLLSTFQSLISQT